MKPIQDFENQTIGKLLNDGHGGYLGECVSLVKRWIEFNGWPMRSGDAIHWQNNGYGGYKFVKWYPWVWWAIEQPGDIAVFDVGPYGHVGIVKASDRANILLLSQNWPGPPKDKKTGKYPVSRLVFNRRSPRYLGVLRYVG